MAYEVVIGLEVHAQLLTRSKMFCPCSAAYVNAPPNTHVCPICLGMPGVLPVINQQAVEYTIMTGLALHCTIPPSSKFDRKNYPYPDLMKGYQISQYDLPLCVNGWLDIDVDGQTKRIGITRVHLEEDVAKLLHRSVGGITYSLMDVNRSGVPLMEIVGEPDLRSPEEARQYLIKLRRILQYLGVSTGNMEEGSFRCDANISLRPVGSTTLSAKVEVKNMNSFRAVHDALAYEVERQTKVLESGGRVVQETRGWVEEQGATISQRSKEFAHDYRYFPEPDLPPLEVSRAWVESLRSQLPELPDARRERFIAEYGLSHYDADQLTSSKAMADFFERTVVAIAGSEDGHVAQAEQHAKAASNWCQGDFNRLLNLHGLEAHETKLTPQHLAELLKLIEAGTINLNSAKAVFQLMFDTGKPASAIVAEQGLTQISAADELTSIVDRVLGQNPQPVADFRSGKQQALGFLLGQVMRETRGRANPGAVQELLRRRLVETA
ncbi:MAG: Asp-tRNA(Asn)/Glu-tRNA(Gln) amidotransferase subunit GatB [Chloroflexi bacterium]|nr:Asp-tRNA(Asn)/Glu-tRNA(Gln) amidotransferase subunit GatB [Chloroflexota bacterium]